MDKLKQHKSINPLAKAKRMARCMFIMVLPNTKDESTPKPGWSTFPI